MEHTPLDYSDSEETDTCHSDGSNSLGAQMSFIYHFMFVFSVVGNGLVLVIIYRFERLTTVTNILLLNLVMSNLIFTSSLPFWGVYMQISDWIFGSAMCKIVGSVYYLGFYSSALFLTLLTFDQHFVIVYSMDATQMRNQCYAVLCCAVVWLVSSLVCVPSMILHTTFYNPFEEKTYCEEYPGDLTDDYVIHLRKCASNIQLLLFLLFPLIVIVYCYIRIAIAVISSKVATKFKTVRLIFTIVLLFFICWIPYNVVLLTENENMTCNERKWWGYAEQVTRYMAYLYFCISPIYYTFVGEKFQNYFRQMVVKRFPGLQKCISVDEVSRTSMFATTTQYI